MTALRAHRRGGPEVLVIEQAPVPVAATGEVLVAVHAAAITFDELTWQETWVRDGVDRTPVIPSHEVSGVVAAVGDARGDLTSYLAECEPVCIVAILCGALEARSSAAIPLYSFCRNDFGVPLH